MLRVDEAGTGPDFVFQHGLCGDAGQTAQVCPEGVHRITLECPGHGASSPEGELSIAAFASGVEKLIADRGLRPVVGGISMGAAIALRLAVRRPDLVRGLVLARPAWGWEAAPANMAPNAEVGAILARGGTRTEFEAGATARRLAEEAPDNLASLRGFFTRAPLEVTARLLTQISADGPGVSEAEVRALALPCLVIGHARDAVHPLALAERLAATIPGARMVRITPKATDAQAYRAEFRAALEAFFQSL